MKAKHPKPAFLMNPADVSLSDLFPDDDAWVEDANELEKNTVARPWKPLQVGITNATANVIALIWYEFTKTLSKAWRA